MEDVSLITANLTIAIHQIMVTGQTMVATDRAKVVAMHPVMVVMYLVMVATEVVQDTDINMVVVSGRSFD